MKKRNLNKVTTKLFPRDESLGFWMYRLHIQRVTTLRKEFQAAGYDLTTEQWALLARLWEQEGINQNQLAEKALKDRHNITRILNRLEKQGHIERRPDENDKRAYRLYLTETGRAVQKKLTPVVLKHIGTMLKGINAEDQQAFHKIIKQIVDNLENRLIEISGADRNKDCQDIE
jgi:DNA-binding MarR family transcriptional regulator